MKFEVAKARNVLPAHMVIIKTRSMNFYEDDVLKLQNPQNDNKISGAIVEKIQTGDEKVLMNKILQDNVGVKIGDIVNIEIVLDSRNADTVELTMPENVPREKIIEAFMKRLNGKPVHLGNKEPLVIGKELEKKVLITTQINETTPAGIVIVTKSTKLKTPLRSNTSGKLVPGASSTEDRQVEIPQVSFGDIGGLDDVKVFLKENIVEGIKNPWIFEEYGTKPKKCILLYGSPGTGKTILAYAVANECDAKLIFIRGPQLKTKWYGETERKIRSTFSEALENAPCILFFDEFDAIQRREFLQTDSSVVTQINTEIDQILNSSESVFLIATTNRPDLIDPAIIRRFKSIEVKFPDKEAREKIFEIHLKKVPVEKIENNVNVSKLAEITKDCSGSDIKDICEEAVGMARRKKEKVGMTHFEKVIETYAKKKEGGEPGPYIG
jgi:AAA+ superfamily predicted ATPase